MNIDDWFDKEMDRLFQMLVEGKITQAEYDADEKEIRAEYFEQIDTQ